MARHLYVYYKVSPVLLHEALAASHQLQLAARKQCKQASVRVRPRAAQALANEPATVMEVYENVFTNFYVPLWLTGRENALSTVERHAEWFEDA